MLSSKTVPYWLFYVNNTRVMLSFFCLSEVRVQSSLFSSAGRTPPQPSSTILPPCTLHLPPTASSLLSVCLLAINHSPCQPVKPPGKGWAELAVLSCWKVLISAITSCRRQRRCWNKRCCCALAGGTGCFVPPISDFLIWCPEQPLQWGKWLTIHKLLHCTQTARAFIMLE